MSEQASKIDRDNPEWTADDFQKAAHFSALPEGLRATLKGRGANKAPTKERITIRLSPEIVSYFRGSGKGWQARINGVLKEWVAAHCASA